MDLFSGTIQKLEKSLDYTSAKNQAITNNIANADTPNYKAKDVAFKNVLNEELSSSVGAKRTDPKHMVFGNASDQSFRTVTRQNTTYNHNGNNVDMDKEMTDLAKNQIQYQGLVDRINGKFSSMQSVLKGGG